MTPPSDELRREWVCLGCDVRVRNVGDRPIPEPAKWSDGRCPHCRVDLARSEGGKEAADALEERLGLRRRQATKPTMGADERRRRVAQVVGEHPDWSNQRVADEIGAPYSAIRSDRDALGLPTLSRGGRPEVTDEQRAAVERELRETFDTEKAIAERVGASVVEVSAVRNALGLPSAPQRRTQAMGKAVAAALAAHPSWSDRRVAEEVGANVPVVRYHRQDLTPSTPSIDSDPPTTKRRRARRARIAAYVKEHPGASNRQVADALREPFGTIRHDRFHMAREGEAATGEAVSAPA